MAPAEGACAPLNPAFVAQMEALLGAEAPAFCAALEAPAALALRVNPARPAAGGLVPAFGLAVFLLRIGHYSCTPSC